jgi:hypothetical protein
MYIHNERTITVKKIRNRLKNDEDIKVSYEINKILQWLLKNKYIVKLKSNSKSPNRYKILDNFNDRKKELEIFYKK